ncbi:minor histocompatibility antigen H13-like [Oppia nitens]|uniref:minor histocompatibility antigen H13-like n=1 Tax=Oppia nitens TaxID=1686743 RepID=UPI0023D99457|nr:minor histocompatibility antigen H13-like [Oppia nitens]
MASETAEHVLNQLKATINTSETNNSTDKFVSSPTGMLCAYGSLIVMALLPIFIGAFRSVIHHKQQKESGETPETMSHKDAAMFPLIASAALFGLYVFFKLFSKEYINLLLTGYFFFLGVLALSHILSPIVNRLTPKAFPIIPYHLIFDKESDDKSESLIDYRFDSRDFITLAISASLGVWYLLKKHWIANNIFGLAFAVNGVELLHLNNVVTGCILLGGLFFYDVFWVFGTDVMVTVAKSFEAPIKLVFPQDFVEHGVNGTHFAMLGLGDIVIPGIFIALLLRFDVSLKRRVNVYFYTSFVAYILGLVLTIVVMAYFRHAQPALLYLVPFCISFPLSVALIRGDIKALFKYEDHPSDEKDGKNHNKETKSSKKDTKKAQ